MTEIIDILGGIENINISHSLSFAEEVHFKTLEEQQMTYAFDIINTILGSISNPEITRKIIKFICNKCIVAILLICLIIDCMWEY